MKVKLPQVLKMTYKGFLMNRIQLSDYVKTHGQPVTAKALGVTQGAISKAIRGSRNIFVIQGKGGSIKAEEIRPFPSQK